MKLNRLERDWILYDVGNSAFTLLVSTILPIYFNYLSEKANLSSVSYMAYWGYAASIGTLIVAIAGPILGTLADEKGNKKPLFTISIIIGAISCICLGLSKQWIIFLGIFIIAKVAYSSSLIFYDSMLSDITENHRMDMVSSAGYAWGYIGSCIPFLISLMLVLGADKLKISMATAYGSALGLNSTGLLLALLVTQIVAFPCSIIFGILSSKFKPENLIMVCITAYLGISLYAMILSTQFQFWILAILVGMFQGGIQALSRSYYAKIIPANKSGEYFGLMDICGKGASFLGTTIVSIVSQLTGNVNKGVGVLSIMFLLGMFLFKLSTSTDISKDNVAMDI